jgi:hypothetical protein
MSAEASAMTLAVAAAAASSSAKNSRCSSRGNSSQHLCRQGRHELVEDTVNLRSLRVFASYLPAGLALRYAASVDPKPPVQPEREEFEAVVCFLDISAIAREFKSKFIRAVAGSTRSWGGGGLSGGGSRSDTGILSVNSRELVIESCPLAWSCPLFSVCLNERPINANYSRVSPLFGESSFILITV